MMSYYTKVNFAFSEDPPSVEDVTKPLCTYLDAQKIYATNDICEDFICGWTKGETDFNGLVSYDIEMIMKHISLVFPNIIFYVRGMGEEFRDVWLRQFEAGKVIYSMGPFEEK
jgi:hypothetical protein